MLNRCLRCNAVFNRVVKEDLCPQCEERARRYARLVDDFLANNRGRDPGMIAAATGVPRRFVVHYLKAQNPSAAAQAEVAGRCVRCGMENVGAGAYCRRCMVGVLQKVQDAVHKDAAQDVESRNDGPGMYSRSADGRRERSGATLRRTRQE